MKTICALVAATFVIIPATLRAEGGGDQDWAEKAARGYEEKARWAEKEGMPKEAAIFRRMAEIKREAGRASKAGKEFKWDEYHELEGKLNEMGKERHEHAKKDDHKDHGKEDPGQGFMRAAEEYRMQAHKAREQGDMDRARIFMQLGEMKMAAAQSAREGKGYDWTRYHELRKKLEGGHEGGDKPHDKPKEWHQPEKPKEWHKPEKPEERPGGGNLNIE